ncbi:MAG: hypothetical protein AAGG81_07285 [Chlamydiota bacterium]
MQHDGRLINSHVPDSTEQISTPSEVLNYPHISTPVQAALSTVDETLQINDTEIQTNLIPLHNSLSERNVDSALIAVPEERTPVFFQNVCLSEQIKYAQQFLNILQKKFSKRMMLGLISLYGKVRMTLQQYEHMGVVLEDLECNDSLPSHSTIRQSFLPYLVNDILVRSHNLSLPATKVNDQITPSTVKKQVMVIKPSSWAMMDLKTLHITEDLFCTDYCSCYQNGLSVSTIERAAIIRDPQNSYNRCQSLWIDSSGYPTQAIEGDSISFTIGELPSPPNANLILDCIQPHGERKDHYVVKCQFRSVFLIEPSTYQSSDQSCLSSAEKLVYSYLQNYVTTPTADIDSNHDVSLCPGDVCALLRFPMISVSSDPIVIAVYISRFWRSRTVGRTNALLFFQVSNKNRTVRYLQNFTTSGVPSLSNRYCQNDSSSNPQKCLTTGSFQSRVKYYIYRFLLYCDDFQARSLMFPKGSLGGCYMIPLGLSLRFRRSNLSVRTISLTPNGVSTNFILDSIIDDLEDAAKRGIESIDCYGNKCIIFIEVVGFVADYPASSSITDVMSHSANSPCTHCTFRILDGPESDLFSLYAHSSHIHSANTSFSRGWEKTRALRLSNINELDANILGMNNGGFGEVDKAGLWPLLKLGEALLSVDDNETCSQESPIPYTLFDAYSRNVIAPDHLITGLITNLIECTFDELGKQKSVLQRL